MSYMAPLVIRSIQAGAFDVPGWQAANAAAESAAESADLDAALAAIGKQSGECAELLAGFSDGDLRAVLCAFAAYRTQLFMYLKACGREELNTMNLWAGIDGSM